VIATSESNYAVEGWLQHFLSGNSEMSVMALDGLWIFIIENWTSVSVFRDQSHASSVFRTRTDATLTKNGAVVLKHEAKATANELDAADNELVDKLFSAAFSQFPMGSNEIVGITTCATETRIHRLFYDTKSEKFRLERYQAYPMNSLEGRVSFLIDIAKICRWIAGITGPISGFHLMFNIRTKTSNDHHVTWCQGGILKEFKHFSNYNGEGGNISDVTIGYINHIHSLNLKNVEWGHPVSGNNRAIMMTRIGRRIEDAIRIKKVSKDNIYNGVVEGLTQLRDIGFAHCDISINNVFVDENGVFLGDLEYLTPLNSPPPHLTRISANSIVSTAQELDILQLKTFALELQRL
jgi:hypothetical protein